MSTINSSLRGRTVQPKIVSAVVERLRAVVPGYNDQNCFESDQPVPAAFSGGRECCTVSIGAGSFPHEFFAGAGSATLVEDGSLIITPMIEVRTDRSWRQKNQLLDGRGLLERKRQILVALFGTPDWEPADGAQPLLRDLLAPLRSSQPGEVMVGEARMVALQLSVQTVFDWDLS